MQIDVEQLKELEPGKTYAIQLVDPMEGERQKIFSENIMKIQKNTGIRFIIFNENVKLTSAPEAVS